MFLQKASAFLVPAAPALAAAPTAAQTAPAFSCDAVSFARLDLPATRIVSATAVRDDPRAGNVTLTPIAKTTALRLAEGRSLSRERRSRIGRELRV